MSAFGWHFQQIQLKLVSGLFQWTFSLMSESTVTRHGHVDIWMQPSHPEGQTCRSSCSKVTIKTTGRSPLKWRCSITLQYKNQQFRNMSLNPSKTHWAALSCPLSWSYKWSLRCWTHAFPEVGAPVLPLWLSVTPVSGQRQSSIVNQTIPLCGQLLSHKHCWTHFYFFTCRASWWTGLLLPTLSESR